MYRAGRRLVQLSEDGRVLDAGKIIEFVYVGWGPCWRTGQWETPFCRNKFFNLPESTLDSGFMPSPEQMVL